MSGFKIDLSKAIDKYCIKDSLLRDSNIILNDQTRIKEFIFKNFEKYYNILKQFESKKKIKEIYLSLKPFQQNLLWFNIKSSNNYVLEELNNNDPIKVKNVIDKIIFQIDGLINILNNYTECSIKKFKDLIYKNHEVCDKNIKKLLEEKEKILEEKRILEYKNPRETPFTLKRLKEIERYNKFLKQINLILKQINIIEEKCKNDLSRLEEYFNYYSERILIKNSSLLSVPKESIPVVLKLPSSQLKNIEELGSVFTKQINGKIKTLINQIKSSHRTTEKSRQSRQSRHRTTEKLKQKSIESPESQAKSLKSHDSSNQHMLNF